MKNLLVFLAFFIIAVTIVTTQDKSKAGPTCIEIPDLTVPDDKRVIVSDCYAQFGEKYDGSVQEPKNITCIWVCYLKKTGLMSEENKFMKDKIVENLKTYGVPTGIVEPLAKEVALCIDTKASTFEIKNGSCDSIKEAFRCFGAAYYKVCNPKKS